SNNSPLRRRRAARRQRMKSLRPSFFWRPIARALFTGPNSRWTEDARPFEGVFDLLSARPVAVRESFQKSHKLVFLLVGQFKFTDGRVHVSEKLRSRPTRSLFTGIALPAPAKCIAGVIEVDDFLKALKVAIVHVRLHEIVTWPFVDIPQSRDLKLAV